MDLKCCLYFAEKFGRSEACKKTFKFWAFWKRGCNIWDALINIKIWHKISVQNLLYWIERSEVDLYYTTTFWWQKLGEARIIKKSFNMLTSSVSNWFSSYFSQNSVLTKRELWRLASPLSIEESKASFQSVASLVQYKAQKITNESFFSLRSSAGNSQKPSFARPFWIRLSDFNIKSRFILRRSEFFISGLKSKH